MSKFSRDNPFYASIIEREPLCRPGCQKNTHHIVLGLDESEITYEVGDCVAILPENDPECVKKIIDKLGQDPETQVSDKRRGDTLPLDKFLIQRANITQLSPKLMTLFGVEKEHLKEYKMNHHLFDALLDREDLNYSPQEICDLLMPLTPRFYSIASSMSEVGKKLDLTVAHLQYDLKSQPRFGVCTHWLCALAPMQSPAIPLYIHPNNGFTLPKDPAIPIIMIGPGTGIAPFRAFLQERVCQKASGKNWLFFGEWHRDKTFYYGAYWLELEAQGKLKLDLAFSRDQQEKVYVQHKMLGKGREFYRWIEEGAVIYVCGDAHRMAKDVEAALLQIISTYGNCNESEAIAFLKELKANKRYLKDVY